MKKKRGLRRYFRNLEKYDNEWKGLVFDNPKLAWFDLWHSHFDWDGIGNKSFKKRKPHLDSLFRHFLILENKAKQLTTDYQIWAFIFDNSSIDDALYLHTPNPNQDNFPIKFETLSTINNFTNNELSKYLNTLVDYKILFGVFDEKCAIVYKPQVGLDII